MLAIPTHYVCKQMPDAQPIEKTKRVVERLVGEHCHMSGGTGRVHGFEDARVQHGVVQETGVVNLEEPSHRLDCWRQVRRGQRALDQERRALANHPHHRLLRQRLAPSLHDELVGRLGQVAAGVDERAVQVENNERSRRAPYRD